MEQINDREYYLTRLAMSRALARRAADPAIAAIHEEFANRYERLAAQPERRDGTRLQAA